jgi:hypothetical protein
VVSQQSAALDSNAAPTPRAGPLNVAMMWGLLIVVILVLGNLL